MMYDLWDLYQREVLMSLCAVSVFILLSIVINEYKRKKQLTDFTHQEDTETNEKESKQSFQWLTQFITYDTKSIQKEFVAAGFYNTKWAFLYMPIKYLFLLIGVACLYFYGPVVGLEQQTMVVIGLVWLVLVLIFPDSFLALRTRALQASISNKLPYLIDLMAVCVQTGMTIESAFDYLAKEMSSFDKDLSYMLTKTNERARVVGLDVALEELYQRVPSSEIRSFVMTLNQSLQYGTSIYQVLGTLSSDIREVQMLGVEEKIGKLAAKMSGPLILFIMLPIVILIAAPGIMRMMSNA